MKTFKDLFLDESATVDGTSRRIIKSSLRMAMANNEPDTRPAPAGDNEEDSSKSGQRKIG